MPGRSEDRDGLDLYLLHSRSEAGREEEEMINNRQWLDNLKVGDPVFITSSGWGMNYTPAVVLKVQKIHFIVAYGVNNAVTYKFRRTDGRKVEGSTWHSTWIVEPTEELKAEIRLDEMIRKAKSMKDNLKVPTDKEGVEAFMEAIKPFVKEEEK